MLGDCIALDVGIYFSIDTIFLRRLPPHVSYATASLIEPLSVAIHATRRTMRNGSLSPGSTVLVIGAGAVGLLVAAMAKLSGATRVIITDINQGRVDFAIKEGFATHGYTVVPPAKYPETIEAKLDAAKEMAANVCKAVEREGGMDVTFECTGMESCVQTGIYVSPTPNKETAHRGSPSSPH